MRTGYPGFLGGLAACTLWVAAFPGLAWASNSYIVRNLTSDVPGLADYTDPNVKGAWGIAESASSPFWVSDNVSGVCTVYSSTGSIIPVVVQILPATRVGFNTPTGSVYNGGSGFAVTTGNPAEFIFATLEGTINGWNKTANATVAEIMADNSASGAVYTGLAIGTSGFSTYLYAADFTNGTIDVFDSNYNPVTLTNAFQDSSIPAGYAPFNIQNLGGNLYVAYAQLNATTNFAATGAGFGYVDVYSTAGTLMQQLVAGGPLNAPWGMAIAPEGFGDYGNGLLVGNFGDGTINVFNPTTGAYITTLANADGAPISIPNLWALQPGNGGSGGDANAVYFTAAIPGPDSGNHGLFGRLQAAPIVTATGVVNGASFQPAVAANTWVTIAGGNLSGTTRGWDNDDFVNSALPTDIDGVVVTVNGMDAYVEYVSPGQLNVLLPVGLTSGQAQLQTYNSGLASAAVTVQVQDVAPAFFLQGDGTHAVATHADGSLVGPASATTGATPAAPGETIVLYGTGFGATNPAAPEGQLITTPLSLAMPPIVTIAATASQVDYAGLIFAGLYQINVTVPAATPGGDAPVVALVGATVSSGSAAIAVQ